MPTDATIEDGSYAPLARPLFVYAKHAALAKPAVRAYVSFMLENAAELVPATGYHVLSDEEYAEGMSRIAEAAGVDTVKELRTRNAANLAAKVEEINNEKKLARTTPSASRISQRPVASARGIIAASVEDLALASQPKPMQNPQWTQAGRLLWGCDRIAIGAGCACRPSLLAPFSNNTPDDFTGSGGTG